jgi:hypothetical protein
MVLYIHTWKGNGLASKVVIGGIWSFLSLMKRIMFKKHVVNWALISFRILNASKWIKFRN